MFECYRPHIAHKTKNSYRTLGALALRNVFTAGTNLYRVASLKALAQDTHKFKSRYLDGLIREYPKEEAIYKARAPIEHVDTLDCPILSLQGDEDKIVPPNQAEKMHEALLKKGIPNALRMYITFSLKKHVRFDMIGTLNISVGVVRLIKSVLPMSWQRRK